MHVFRRPSETNANNINAMTEDGQMHVKETNTQARAKKTGNDSMMKLADTACREQLPEPARGRQPASQPGPWLAVCWLQGHPDAIAKAVLFEELASWHVHDAIGDPPWLDSQGLREATKSSLLLRAAELEGGQTPSIYTYVHTQKRLFRFHRHLFLVRASPMMLL
jgi:hypothetical protein